MAFKDFGFLLAFIVVAVVCFSIGYSANNWRTYDDPPSENRYCQQHQNAGKKNKKPSSPVSVQNTSGNKKETNTHVKDNSYDLCQQWRMAEYAKKTADTSWVQIYINIGGLLGLLATIIYAGLAINVNRDIGRKQTRAYLTCIKGKAYLSEERLYCEIKVRNNGQSPAISAEIIEAHAFWHRVEATVDGETTHQPYSTFPTGSHSVAISAQSNEQIVVAWEMPRMIEAAVNPNVDILNDCTSLTLSFKLIWTDVFGEKEDPRGFTLYCHGLSEINESGKRIGKLKAHSVEYNT